MRHSPTDPALPVIAIAYGLGSATPVEIATSASGLCSIVWAYDSSDGTSEDLLTLLEWTGQICDVTRCTPAEGLARLRPWRPAGITTFAESRIRWTAGVADGLGLPYHSAHTATRLTDKHAQRSELASAGLDPIRFARVDRPDHIAAALAHVGLPAVVKPVCGAASRNTERLDSPAAATALISDLLTGVPPRRESAVLIEELLVGDPARAGDGWGDYVSVESLVVDSHPHHLAVLGKFELAPPFRECGTFYPSTLAPADIEDAERVASRAIRALDVRHGITHAELKLTPTGPRLVEVNGRLGGGVKAVLEQAAGYDVIGAALRYALGVPAGLPQPSALTPSSAGGVGFQYLPPAPQRVGVVAGLHGLREAQSMAGVASVATTIEPRTRLDWREGTLTHLATVIGRVETHAALRELVRALDKVLHVELAPADLDHAER